MTFVMELLRDFKNTIYEKRKFLEKFDKYLIFNMKER